MKFAKKMVLVEYPPSRISTRFNNAYSKIDDFSAEPTSNVLSNLDSDMRKILRRPDLSDREKWFQYKQILQRYLNFVSQKRHNAKKNDDLRSKNTFIYAGDDDQRVWSVNDTPPIRASTSQYSDRNVHDEQEYEFDDNSVHVPDGYDDDDEIERELEEARKPDAKLTIAQPKILKVPSDFQSFNPELVNNSNIAVRKPRSTVRQSPYSRKSWVKVKLEK